MLAFERVLLTNVQGSSFTGFPQLERVELRDIRHNANPMAILLHDVASVVKGIFLDLRNAMKARGASDSYKLKSLMISNSSVPKAWMTWDTTIDWCSESMAWDGKCWDDYWHIPFDNVQSSAA